MTVSIRFYERSEWVLTRLLRTVYGVRRRNGRDNLVTYYSFITISYHLLLPVVLLVLTYIVVFVS